MQRLTTCFAVLSILLASGNATAQKLKFKEKLKVKVDGSDNYKVHYIPVATVTKTQTVTYDASTKLPAFYTETEKPDWRTPKEVINTDITLPAIIQKVDLLFADIKAEEGRLMIYFWPHVAKDPSIKKNSGTSVEIVEANKFYKDHIFSIQLPDRENIAFRHSAFQAGVMTLPVRVFIGGPDSVSSVSSAVNVGLYVGRRWGKTRFVKLPDEKEVTSYENSQSFNIIAGISKLDLDENNTVDDGKTFKGSIGVISTGLSYGFHYKSFSIFGAVGIDLPLSERGKLWSMKGKPWIGFGAGFEIF